MFSEHHSCNNFVLKFVMASLTTGGNVRTEEGDEYLMCARYGECEDMVAFVKWGVPVDYVNESKSTALHYACANGHLDCVQALVLELNASHLPNLSNNYPLHWAVEHKHNEIISLLCGRDGNYVDVLAKNGFGKSSLTVGFTTEDADIVKMLLEHSSADALEKNRTSNQAKQKIVPKQKKKTSSAAAALSSDQAAQGETKQKEIKLTTQQDKASGKANGEDVQEDPTTTTAAAAAASSGDQDYSLKRVDEAPDVPALPPAEREVKQRVVHVFDLVTPPPGVPPTLVRVQELAIDWEGAAFTEDDDASKDVTGLYVWSAAVVLAKWLVSDAAIVASLASKRVCELGAGAGLPGIAVAAHTNATSVLLTDLFSHTVKNMQDNIAMNHFASASSKLAAASIRASSLDWSNTDAWPVEKMDVVIGSDLVYSKTMVPTLVSVVVGLLPKDGLFYYAASTSERDGMLEFVSLMKSSGFVLDGEMLAPSEYHANPLHQATQSKCERHFPGLKAKKFALYKWRKTV